MTNYVINPVQTVGEFLPNVYINKITLRSDTGYTQSKFQQNPHIDPTAEQTAQGIVEGAMEHGDGSLQVEIALTLKDVLGAGGTSQWFSSGRISNGKTLKDYVMVNVVQAYTPAAITEWSRKMAAGNIYNNAAQLITGAGISYISLSLSEFGAADSLSRYTTEFDAGGNAIKNIGKSIFSTDAAWKPGDAAHNPALPASPTDLAYFVWTSIDLDLLARDFNIDTTIFPEDGSQMISKVNSDVVFRNNKMIKEAYVFFEAIRTGNNLTRTDKLWTGPTHYHSGVQSEYEGYMGGQRHIADATRIEQPYLMRQAVPNTKIEDFRVTTRLDKLELNFSTFENEILQALTQNRRVIDDNNLKFSYFTNINLSRDQDNNCRFMFGIDLRKIVRENTPYSKLFSVSAQENPPWFIEVMKRVRILSMKIFRKRVAGSSETGTTPYYFPSDATFDPPSNLRSFDGALTRNTRNVGTSADPKYVSYDPAKELILDAGEVHGGSNGDLLFIGDGQASVDRASTITQLKNVYTNNFRQLYYYTGTDATMSSKSDGYYQYVLELEIEDGVVEFLNEKRAELLVELEKLKQYYNDGTKTAAVYGSGDTQTAHFDPTTNRFTQAFQNSPGGVNWPKSVGMKYVQVLQIFTELTSEEKVLFMNTLNLYVSPKSGNPQGCLAVMNLYDNLITFINSAMGVQKERGINLPKDVDATNSTGTSNNVFDVDVGTSGQPSLNKFKVQHTFSDYYDANMPSNTGYDFLGAGYNGPNFPRIPDTTGLRVVSNDRWQTSIVSKELTKIFNGINSRIDLPNFIEGGITPDNTLRRTDFSYLTPAVVYAGPSVTLPMIGQNTEIPPNISERDFMNMSAGSLTTITNNITDTNTLEERVADFLSYNYNLTVVPSPNPTVRLNPPGTITTEGPASSPILDYIEGANAQTNENLKAFSVFWNLISNGVVSQGNRAGVSLPEGSSQKSISYYNPGESSGFKNALLAAIAPSDPDRTALIKGKMDNLPNSVKALIRYNYENYSLTQGQDFGGGALKPQIDNFLSSEPFENPTFSSKARILFETIGEIQYLDGYGQTKYSHNGSDVMEFSTGMPIWKTLDRDAYSRIGNLSAENAKALLCRIQPWESDVFKIKRHPGNDLPTYEEYFILNAGNAPLARTHSRDEEFTIPASPIEPYIPQPPEYTLNTNWVVEEITTPGNLVAAESPPPPTTAVPGAPGGTFTAANASQMQQNIQASVATSNTAGDNSSGAPMQSSLPGAAGSNFAPASGQQTSNQQSSGQQSATSTNPLGGLSSGGSGGNYGS
tara:strand:+ start:4326 stop:8201 length:3876 start_codon:yes stop_codon:yes gene_type:complete